MNGLFDIIIQYKSGFWNGIIVTFQISLIVWIVGLFLGSILGIASARWLKIIGTPSSIISFFLSGIPVLVFLFWLHYPFQAIINIVIDPFYTTVITLSIINIFSVSEAIKSTILNLPYQYIEAAKVCGIKPKDIFLKIELPLVFKNVIPHLLTLQVSMLHMTLFASLISVEEIFRITQRINAVVYKPIELYTALGVFFLIISLPINGVAYWLKKKYGRNLSER